MTSFPRTQSRCALIVCQNCNSRKPTDVFLPCRRRRYSAAETLPETAMRASCSTSALCVPKASADYVTIAPIQTPQVTKHSSQLRWFRPSSPAHMTSSPRSQNPPAGVYRTHRAGPGAQTDQLVEHGQHEKRGLSVIILTELVQVFIAHF